MTQLPVVRITLARDPLAKTANYTSLFLSDTNRSPYTAASRLARRRNWMPLPTTPPPALSSSLIRKT